MPALLELRRSRLVITLEESEYLSPLLRSIGFVFFGGFGYILQTNSGLLFETEYYLTTKKKDLTSECRPNEYNRFTATRK